MILKIIIKSKQKMEMEIIKWMEIKNKMETVTLLRNLKDDVNQNHDKSEIYWRTLQYIYVIQLYILYILWWIFEFGLTRKILNKIFSISYNDYMYWNIYVNVLNSN